MSIRIISAADVRELLPMSECMGVMREAMVALSHGQVSLPPRLVTGLHDGSGVMFLMPGSSASPPTAGAKLLTFKAGNPVSGFPALQGVVILFDPSNGSAMALLDGAELTAIRTAAVSGLATEMLARQDATTHGVFGTGAQARLHIDAVHTARPNISKVWVWGRDPVRARAFASEQSRRTGLDVCAADAATTGACDVVSTCTAATEPVLQGAWLVDGAHVNAVGAYEPGDREVDSVAIQRASIYVDLMASAMNEAGDLLVPMTEGIAVREQIVGELGQLAAGEIAGRTSHSQITFFKSLGVVAEDLFAGSSVYQRAIAQGRGVAVDL